MAGITALNKIRRQQAAFGGIMGRDGRRQYGGGSDMGQVADSKGNTGPGTGGYQGGPVGGYGDAGRTGPTDKNPYDKTPEQFKEIREKEKAKYEKQFDGISPLGSRPVNFFTKVNYYDKKYKANWAAKQKQKQLAAIDKLIAKTYTTNPHMDIAEIRDALMSQYDGTTNTMTGLEGFNVGKPGMNYGPTQLGPLGLKTTGAKGQPLGTKYLDQTPSLYSRINLPGLLGKLQGKTSINNLMSSINRINQLTDIQKDGVTQGEITDYYDKAMGRGKYDIFGGGGDGDNSRPYLPIDYNTGAATTEAVEPYTNNFTYRFGNEQKDGANVLRGYAADGGIMGTRARRAMGGIMNRVDQRQGYFLGKIVKSVGKAVSGVAKAAGKVLSSDVGKMALLAGGAYYLGGGTFGGLRSSAPGFKFGNIGGGISSLAKKALLKDSSLGFTKGNYSLGKILGLSAALPFIPGINKAPENEDIGMADRGGRLLDSKGNEVLPAGIRAEIDGAYESGDPEQIKAIEKYYAFLPPTEQYLPYSNYGSQGYRTTVATGGRIRAEEGGLMNLGGMEKDYRAEGGFVPIGKQEKADDVPARLSVNEFVFTADAVRNAGSGDIDKGNNRIT